MKRIFLLNVTVSMVLVFLFYGQVKAGNDLNSTGIGLRGSFYAFDDRASHIYVRDYNHYSDVNIGGFGGSIFLLSRMHDQFQFEITLGAIGHVEEHSVFYDQEEVDVLALNPLLFGIQYEPIPYRRIRNIIPYVSAGLGPYWISEINAREEYQGDEVTVNTHVKPGGYLGGGFNFGISNGFAINFDLKYHMIDLDLNHKYSGFEYGVGFTIYWGKFE